MRVHRDYADPQDPTRVAAHFEIVDVSFTKTMDAYLRRLLSLDAALAKDAAKKTALIGKIRNTLRAELEATREGNPPAWANCLTVKPLGEARPGWKVLRVLGNLAGVADFDYQSSEEVREELRALCGGVTASSYQGSHEAKVSASDARVIDVPMYAVDAVLRRAPSLQRTREGKGAPVAYGGGQGA